MSCRLARKNNQIVAGAKHSNSAREWRGERAPTQYSAKRQRVEAFANRAWPADLSPQAESRNEIRAQPPNLRAYLVLRSLTGARLYS